MLDPLELRPLLAHAVPVSLALGGITAGRAAATSAWRRAHVVVASAAVLALAALVCDRSAVGALVQMLIVCIGWVIARFAATYLAGESGQPSFVRWLLLTLAGSSLVAATDHLAVLTVAWLGASLSLGKLLTFYGQRPAALMAAHKKFLVSRLADLCMVTACVLLAQAFGTLRLGELSQRVAAGEPLSTAAQFAVVLIALAALLKSAQLPFHGWLMQVMEAPTPVSALLHAGVVNLGGFVLIRAAPLVNSVPAAQTLLVVVGSLTAALAGLVASTRISIKVALAWSTCAQMGFMVMQCGLGLHEMAVLHLVAHSLYKACCFLEAGTTVAHAVVRAMTPVDVLVAGSVRALAAVAGVGMVAAVGWLCGEDFAARPALLAVAVIVGLALAPLLSFDRAGRRLLSPLRGLCAAFVVAAAYLLLHRLMHRWLGFGDAEASVPLVLWVIGCFLSLFVAQSVLAVRPQGAFAQRMHAWFYGGLFLDEWFTRLTLRLWPVRVESTRTGNGHSA